jgi:hypothetical protein
MIQYSATTKRCASVAHTYRFYTGSLGINKEIAAEAKNELCRTNTFIIVAWEWPDFSSKVHPWDVPIVTEDYNAIAEVSMDSMYVELYHPEAPPNTPWHAREGVFARSQILMLLPDFTLFSRVARWESLVRTSEGNHYNIRLRLLNRNALTI